MAILIEMISRMLLNPNKDTQGSGSEIQWIM